MATTKENVKQKVKALLEGIDDHLNRKLDVLLNSGVIDFKQEDDNWGLPKDIVLALAEEIKFQYGSFHATRKDKQRINNYYKTLRYGGI